MTSRMRTRWPRGSHSGRIYSGSTAEYTATATAAATAASAGVVTKLRGRHWRSGRVSALLILLVAIASFDIGALMGGITSPVNVSIPASRIGPGDAYRLLHVSSGRHCASRIAVKMGNNLRYSAGSRLHFRTTECRIIPKSNRDQ